jgi:hypothetical protein
VVVRNLCRHRAADQGAGVVRDVEAWLLGEGGEDVPVGTVVDALAEPRADRRCEERSRRGVRADARRSAGGARVYRTGRSAEGGAGCVAVAVRLWSRPSGLGGRGGPGPALEGRSLSALKGAQFRPGLKSLSCDRPQLADPRRKAGEAGGKSRLVSRLASQRRRRHETDLASHVGWF